jgi:predicted site-specific integrase-resolvase
VFAICEKFEVEVVILNKKEQSTFEEDLASDVLEIITIFSARLYGSKSHQNKKLMENLAKSLQID